MESKQLARAETERKENIAVTTDTYSVPWLHGSITVKVITQNFVVANLVNYSYEVRRRNRLIESNRTTNPDVVIERIEYYTNIEV